MEQKKQTIKHNTKHYKQHKNTVNFHSQQINCKKKKKKKKGVWLFKNYFVNSMKF